MREKNEQLQMLMQLDVDVAQDRNVTIARVIAPQGTNFVVIGSAKRTPGDQHHPAIGIQLALGRMFENLAAAYLEQADALVAENCGMHPEGPTADFHEQELEVMAQERFKNAFRK